MYSKAPIKTVAAAGNAARKSIFQESPQDEENSIFEKAALSIILFKNFTKNDSPLCKTARATQQMPVARA